ncbi:MAG: MBL fold metallo-hydrolase [Mycobacteriales bacterium]|jgi:glyoxylase-like metal-dependent hydrolase (beta-lactamase superfamily II)
MPYTLVRADNPGPMTLEGTNTYLLHGDSGTVVVDPGPADPAHLEAIGVRDVVAIVLTHTHPDHVDGVPALAGRFGVDTWAADPDRVPIPAEPLEEGDYVLGGVTFTVLATPGHTADSVCFVTADGVLTGDTILGRGTTVVTHPDGDLGRYLDSLRRLEALAETAGDRPVLPGHGPELPSLAAAARHYLAHREERLDQVRAAVAAGDRTPAEVVARVYADVDRALWPAAEQSVRAQLDYLDSLRERE